MTNPIASGFVLGTTLLNQGPAALGTLVATQSTLLDDGEEARGLLMVVGSIASRLTLGDLREMRVGRYGNKDFHGKVRQFASDVRDSAAPKGPLQKILEELSKLSTDRLAAIVAQTRSAGLSLFGTTAAAVANARERLGATALAADAFADVDIDRNIYYHYLGKGTPPAEKARAMYDLIISNATVSADVDFALRLLIWGTIAEGLPNRVFLHYLTLLALTEPEIFKERHKQEIEKARMSTLEERKTSWISNKLDAIQRILRFPHGTVPAHDHPFSGHE